MKLAKLSTDDALNALCELTPYIKNITTDKAVLDVFAEKMDTKDMTIMSVKIISASRYSEVLSVLLNTHRPDIYGILSVVNQKTPSEIAAQPLIKTMEQFREVFWDEEFINFFKSFVPQAAKEQSAPSAASRASV